MSKYTWLEIPKEVIYLTFDEARNGYTLAYINMLAENNVKAVFFITGPYLKEHQDLVRRMLEEGHVVGNHTIHHPSLPELSDSQLEEEVLGLDRAFREKFGQSMVFLRPPKGEYSERTLALTQNLILQLIQTLHMMIENMTRAEGLSMRMILSCAIYNGQYCCACLSRIMPGS